MTPKFGITQYQALVSEVLLALKLGPNQTDVPGRDPRHTVTLATVDYLSTLVGRTLVVAADGSVIVE